METKRHSSVSREWSQLQKRQPCVQSHDCCNGQLAFDLVTLHDLFHQEWSSVCPAWHSLPISGLGQDSLSLKVVSVKYNPEDSQMHPSCFLPSAVPLLWRTCIVAICCGWFLGQEKIAQAKWCPLHQLLISATAPATHHPHPSEREAANCELGD